MEKSNPTPTNPKAPQSNDGKMADLPMRIVSGVTLLLLVLFAVYKGGDIFFVTLMAVMFAGAYEWAGLCGIPSVWKRLGYGALVTGVIVYSRFDYTISGFAFDRVPVIALVLAVLTVASHAFGREKSHKFNRINVYLATFGIFYLWVTGYFLVELRDISVVYIYGLIAVLIGVDVGAYFAGRFLGGPKIWVALSPKKTWAGLLGAVLGVIVIMSLPIPVTVEGESIDSLMALLGLDLDVMVALAIVISVVAQAGDFLESWMKRRVNVKDSSRLIPGHGGFLDRMDGYLSVVLFLSLCAF